MNYAHSEGDLEQALATHFAGLSVLVLLIWNADAVLPDVAEVTLILTSCTTYTYCITT